MGKKKDKKQLIQQSRNKRKQDKQYKNKMRNKMMKGDGFKLSKQYVDYFDNFTKELKPLRIKIRDVGGDGSCLFRSFADQLDGTQLTHMVMRDSACRYMQENQEFFRPFLDEDEDGNFNKYIKAMKKNGEWGGHLELQALSECFRLLIIVHKRQLEQFNIRPMTQDPKMIIHLAYFQHQDFQHYASIRDIQDNSENPAIEMLQPLNKNMYNQMLYEDQQEYLMMKQMEELQIIEKMNQYQKEEVQEQKEPYPNYPKNKKCKCGSKIQYKKCCYKEWQISLNSKFGY